MDQHGLLQAGWRFRWSHGKRQLGSTQVKRVPHPATGKIIEIRTISISRHLVQLNSDGEVRDTILHEIAHALVGIEHGHDHVWRAMCRRIGARPNRLAGETVKVAEAPYVLVCGCCQRVLARRYRRMRVPQLKRLMCRQCGAKSQGRLHQRAAEDSQAADATD